MNFTLPSADNLGQLAHPNNKSSKLQTEATINNALNSFRRFTNDTDSKHYTIKLKSLPKFAGINNSGEAHFYSYNTTDQLLKKKNLLSHY
jgi:hypothetical protein